MGKTNLFTSYASIIVYIAIILCVSGRVNVFLGWEGVFESIWEYLKVCANERKYVCRWVGVCRCVYLGIGACESTFVWLHMYISAWKCEFTYPRMHVETWVWVCVIFHFWRIKTTSIPLNNFCNRNVVSEQFLFRLHFYSWTLTRSPLPFAFMVYYWRHNTLSNTPDRVNWWPITFSDEHSYAYQLLSDRIFPARNFYLIGGIVLIIVFLVVTIIRIETIAEANEVVHVVWGNEHVDFLH